MLRSIQSPPEDHDGRLRNLIDQRNALANIHGRFSTAMSESSDTPSVYSHSFSPRFSEISESHIAYPYSTAVPSTKGAGYNVHNAHDLSEDSRLSFASEDHSRKNDTSDEDAGDDDAETIARMSYLGPKMRFHSRAPWEEDALQEEEEEDFMPFKNTIKNVVSSPRPSFASSVNRPSEDSSNSQPSTKRSFETVNSQLSFSHPRGGLYSLAQESMSTNSLGQRPPKESLRSKFPSRLRNETSNISSSPRSQSPVPSPVNSHIPIEVPQTSPGGSFPSDSVRSNSSESYENSALIGSIHPYAHPDLVVSYAEEGPTGATTQTHLSHALPPDSKFKVRESISVDSMAKSSQSTLTPDSSMNSFGSRLRSSPINTKSISSPVSVIGSVQPFSGNSLERVGGQRVPGWTERSSSAPLTLISLEEARAQRMRASTDGGVSTILSLDSTTPFPRNNSDSASTSSPSSPLSYVASSARGRSISAGAKAKIALQSIVGQPKVEKHFEPVLREDIVPSGLPPVKTLKNKKSGLMRLFNKEKDNQNPPPVPALPEGVHQLTVVRRTTPSAVQRVPVPPISPARLTSSSGGSPWQTENPVKNNNLTCSPHSALSINTTLTAATSTPPAQAADGLTAHTRPDPDSHIHSAPPNLLEFPVLRLRPVSTLFSASFGDLVPPESPPRNEATNPTPSRSPTTTSLRPPFTPVSISRPNHDHPQIISASSIVAEEQSDLKILSTKNAWNKRIWELEGQVRDLKVELEELKAKNEDFCDKCGRGRSVINDTRARTSSSRFVDP